MPIISPTAISPHRIWSSYWATRRPGMKNLTVLSDTSIKVDWEANGVEDYDGYSLERSADGVTYAEVDTIAVGTETFTDTGLTANTYYWYRVRAYKGTEYSPYSYSKIAITETAYDNDNHNIVVVDHTSGITKDESDLVSAWGDLSGNGNNLVQADGAKQLTWEADGVKGNGADEFIQNTSIAALDQPTFIYAFIKHYTYTQFDNLISGASAATQVFLRQNGGTPKFKVYAGTESADLSLTLKRWGLVKILFNGASSKFFLDGQERTANYGANNMGGVTLFAKPDGTLSCHGKIAEARFRDSADDAATEAAITKYFEMRHQKKVLHDIYAMVGNELVLYDNTICEVKIAEEPATGTFTCAVGTDGETGFAYTPEGAGSNALTINIVTDENDWLRTTDVVAYAASGTGTKKILMIGDSILNHGASTICTQMRSVLDHLTLQFLGTVGTAPNLSEGKSAYTYATFCTADASPFVKNRQVDIAAYFTDNSIDTPDFVHLRCGVNDANTVKASATGFTWAQLQAVGGYIDTLVNGFLAYDANLKVIIGIPTLCDMTGGVMTDQDNYIKAICQLRNYIESKYGEKAYNARVYLSADGYSMSRANYPVTEGVHPDADGERQIANSIAYTINAILAGA